MVTYDNDMTYEYGYGYYYYSVFRRVQLESLLETLRYKEINKTNYNNNMLVVCCAISAGVYCNNQSF